VWDSDYCKPDGQANKGQPLPPFPGRGLGLRQREESTSSGWCRLLTPAPSWRLLPAGERARASALPHRRQQPARGPAGRPARGPAGVPSGRGRPRGTARRWRGRRPAWRSRRSTGGRPSGAGAWGGGARAGEKGEGGSTTLSRPRGGSASTTGPGARKAHRPAGGTPLLGTAGPRRAGSFQSAVPRSGVPPTAGLKQPSLRRMASQTLRRRNAARVTSTEARPGLPQPFYPCPGPGKRLGVALRLRLGCAGRGADFSLAGGARPG
jgi:hypothetical protein